jgi:diguanylate cyclase (GGDEF)-like protein
MDTVSDQLSSVAGLTVQCAGIILVAVLSFFMTKSIRRDSLNYWTQAWGCLAVALTLLLIGFRIPPLARIVQPFYFLGEYAFGYLFWAGCRNRANGAKLGRSSLYLGAAAIPLAFGLAYGSNDFNKKFIVQAAIMSGLFTVALFTLGRVRANTSTRLGMRIMSVALLLLAIDFFHYVPVFVYALFWQPSLPVRYLQYTSIYDLILEILLGFGAVMVVMDDVNRELEDANRELTTARDRLEVLARMDPLTEALNRHAFYSLTSESAKSPGQSLAGCVVVVDIDDLKPINDSIGHAAGDDVIRAVANLIRSVIRASDLLFRWGGDEFLVILFGVAESDVGGRIERLNRSVSSIVLPGSAEPVGVTVSYGVASFVSASQIEQAIERADREMYQSKQSRKRTPQALRGTTAPLQEPDNRTTAAHSGKLNTL